MNFPQPVRAHTQGVFHREYAHRHSLLTWQLAQLRVRIAQLCGRLVRRALPPQSTLEPHQGRCVPHAKIVRGDAWHTSKFCRELLEKQWDRLQDVDATAMLTVYDIAIGALNIATNVEHGAVARR